jgi:hypothetical protein
MGYKETPAFTMIFIEDKIYLTRQGKDHWINCNFKKALIKITKRIKILVMHINL